MSTLTRDDHDRICTAKAKREKRLAKWLAQHKNDAPSPEVLGLRRKTAGEQILIPLPEPCPEDLPHPEDPSR